MLLLAEAVAVETKGRRWGTSHESPSITNQSTHCGEERSDAGPPALAAPLRFRSLGRDDEKAVGVLIGKRFVVIVAVKQSRGATANVTFSIASI